MTQQPFPVIAPDAPVDHSELCRFASLHELIVMETQQAFREWLGEDSMKPFTVDPDAGTLTLGKRTFKAQLLGSLSKLDNTWLWSWANSGFQGNPMAEAAIWLRDASPHHDRVWQLRTAKFPVDEQSSTEGAPAWALQFSCFAWLAPRAQYSGSYGPGRAFLTIHDESVPRFEASPVRFPQLVMHLVSQGWEVTEPVRAYAQWFGAEFSGDESGGWRIGFQDGTAYQATFDEYGRMTRLTSV
ncbi:DUF6882 domain-containing protein [Propionibacterium australiense]|uniref:Uncharacterized protein n=1 Tax=Propionibacterium australiense TaxID=119981 RepID=A0A383S2T2_9ACTN|nr:DUF6882 domain-containing protein [Propionibacterium australiense]RLP11615.1 hypothetical protein D9T14_03150 [Propionibacterium australiense]SYZ32338.1 Hypothetical protein PROPAUS_0214 [Propionibacterium australiense]VEH90410.1 Uncharacterised protein [Propionibacterium australiense]